MTTPKYDGVAMLRDAATRHGICLSTLVAETGLWAHPEVHKKLLAVGGSAAVYPNCRRARAGQGERRGQHVGNLKLDDNTYANNAIKGALGVSRANLSGFETCHIWPLTCYDERYHTAIANLVLLPRALAALTDHDADVRAALQYRSYVLYGWHPSESSEPLRPANYPETWLDPLQLSATSAQTRQTRSRTSFDVTVAGITTYGLSKRLAILAVVRGMVAAGVMPRQICSVLDWRGGRLFRSAIGKLSSSELVQSLSLEAQTRGKTFDPIRFFCKDSDLIFADGQTYSFSNQWGEDTEQAIDALLRVLPMRNVSCNPSRR